MRYSYIIFVVLILSACATRYKPHGIAGGFSETQLGENIWQVRFEGNGYTSSQRANDLALLRCAELTLEKGFSHFGLAGSSSGNSVSAFTTPTTSYTTGNAYSTGNYAYGNATTYTTGGQTLFISFPSSSNTVVMFKEKPQAQGMIFDAKFICQSLGKKYKVTCGAHH